MIAWKTSNESLRRPWGHSRFFANKKTALRKIILKSNDPAEIFGKMKDKAYLDLAARKFSLGLEKGIDEDEMVALEFGTSLDAMTEVQVKYMEKVKEKLQKRAEELRAEDEAMEARLAKTLVLGKEAYECGEYLAAVRLLEQSVKELGSDTKLAGEAHLWLALSYQACGREKDAIDTCKFIEENHPIRKIKKQATDLRYIFEAPKLELSEEERIQIPIIQSDTWRQKDRKGSMQSKLKAKKKPVSTSYWDRAEWKMPSPDYMPDQWYIRVAWAVVGAVFVIFLNMQAIVAR
ncbi:hypothetical protein CEUSTIGMA_g1311.t1 [Chlamydomonas eustigma]|uniref:Uncharacterized protein n=1 Tax=Chlamydomonas eustigma TaxID=1157962 RepID=A0A250WST8_9CHLO|nr:hypothetical protein CEUSTIGMA_g1311.t1 [Chlamydomonas eustigma]|eukprot:GAX73861.1 hypothetical protein CEUSTIGMA_g1311.t1 [Chlamydomonas eustigma]